jgi:hypothetical protein
MAPVPEELRPLTSVKSVGHLTICRLSSTFTLLCIILYSYQPCTKITSDYKKRCFVQKQATTSSVHPRLFVQSHSYLLCICRSLSGKPLASVYRRYKFPEKLALRHSAKGLRSSIGRSKSGRKFGLRFAFLIIRNLLFYLSVFRATSPMPSGKTRALPRRSPSPEEGPHTHNVRGVLN